MKKIIEGIWTHLLDIAFIVGLMGLILLAGLVFSL